LSKESGKCRFAENGLGWKPSSGGNTFTLDRGDIVSAQWSRAAKGYEVKVLKRSSELVLIDGFQQEDFERLSKLFKLWYSINLDSKEHALRGWNWGKTEFSKAELVFNVQNKPAFEIPYTEISNTNLAGRNEVAVEFTPSNEEDTGTNGHLGGARGRGKKSGAGKDQLVEMRFYIPGTSSRKETEGEEAGSDAEQEEKNAATLFYETLIDKAEIGETAGDAIATFLEVLHLTPRFVFPILLSIQLLDLTGLTNVSLVAGSILTCTKRRSAFVARHTITRFSTTRSRSLWCSLNPTSCISCFASAWIPLYAKAKRDTPSLLCKRKRTRRSPLI
jgi:structure-specific recognition protein 1